MTSSRDEYLDTLKRLYYTAMTTKSLALEGDGETTYTETKSCFGGNQPFLLRNEDWPVCGQCEAPMTFFFQIDLEKVSKEPEFKTATGGVGLLQLFVCTSEDGCETFEAYNDASLVRILAPEQLAASKDSTKLRKFEPEESSEQFPQHDIQYWSKGGEDLPALEELTKILEEASLPMIEYDENEADPELAMRGIKLLGWPNWVQSPEYQECRKSGCTQIMKLLMQVEESDDLPFMWGDAGTAYLQQCPEHKDSLAFVWQCC
ncbi:hypothetical protein K493DRAFT_295648 [Basidiobolus meristosporus CBS 931.73]|uniref:DUF1963-domain-containing protein n=1 Tax=Basidiobolus meristosporus CBS 931.73 TaxID=1314790 RepID=A0A1Y1Z9V4_9FUNG|nr:hypothetical protein K493DRAFT_295648 [Basidiobolus meristosporus CBS 931.73]|eukprot:ORY07073.1 hypothetical protein K493DRAFT_295648 [Basidiobolus meristosporus CBS 931.73]